MPKAEVKTFLDDEPKQYLMLVDKTALSPGENASDKGSFCSLRHPLTETKCLFLFTHSNQNVFEIHNFKEEFRSWFVDDSIIQGGTTLLITPLDPLFLALPYLQKAQKKTGKFMTLDQIVEDEEFPESRRLHESLGLKDLSYVADVKDSKDLQAYRYSEEKTLKWLQQKMTRISHLLCNNDVSVSKGVSQSKNFVKSKKEDSDETPMDKLVYAFEMLSNYISADLSDKLSEFYGLPKAEELKVKSSEPPKKKIKTEPLSGPSEDYSQHQKSSESSKTPKLTPAQKKLSQVDKSGMKSISSFFSPKSKS